MFLETQSGIPPGRAETVSCSVVEVLDLAGAHVVERVVAPISTPSDEHPGARRCDTAAAARDCGRGRTADVCVVQRVQQDRPPRKPRLGRPEASSARIAHCGTGLEADPAERIRDLVLSGGSRRKLTQRRLPARQMAPRLVGAALRADPGTDRDRPAWRTSRRRYPAAWR